MEKQEQTSRYTLSNRYLFKGQLVMRTALHIGGGRITQSNSNSPVVLTPEGLPFIPGSSFKGSLRSTVEKLVPNLPGNLLSCSLIELSDEQIKQASGQGKPICSTIRQKDITQKRRDNPEKVEEILAEARENLCHTCQLFGSPFAASRVMINDLYMPEGTWNDIIQTRDGVAIERDSEKAKDRLKYDFEVVPASTAFNLEIQLENATPRDLQLLCVGLSDFVHGLGTIGGKRSRGLGACILENLHVYTLELSKIEDTQERNRRLRNYLLGKTLEQKFASEEDGQAFLETHINKLFEGVPL